MKSIKLTGIFFKISNRVVDQFKVFLVPTEILNPNYAVNCPARTYVSGDQIRYVLL